MASRFFAIGTAAALGGNSSRRGLDATAPAFARERTPGTSRLKVFGSRSLRLYLEF